MKRLLKAAAAFLFALSSLAHSALLPRGPEPEPIAVAHFPSRLHAFVWRNWNLLPAERLASVLGTTPEKVSEIAASLGCDMERESFFGRRISLTLIRRNWHLLNYPQLLKLLKWSEKELAQCLIEHDFFWIKLGRLKPRCAPLTFHEPTAREKKRAQWFKEIVLSEKKRVADEKRERRFAFLNALTSLPSKRAEAAPGAGAFSLRFIYSYFAVFGDPLLYPELDPYPGGYLARLAACGVNGVWLHVVLKNLAPGELFPEERERAEKRLGNLRRLVERAAKYGIGVYLYFNEPRAQDESFFKRHPELRGVREGNLSTLCTSTPEVKKFLREGARHVFASVPGLAGFFTITASENLTNCHSHHRGAACPRCGKRAPAQVVAEVNTLLAEGAWEASPGAEAIVWDWGWGENWVEEIAKLLPRKCRLMSVSEWWVPIERGGVKSAVGEYSLSAVGPGPRARSHWKLAEKYGLRTVAKVQINNTWELSSVPFIPVPGNVAEHMTRLRACGLSGLMLSWSLGGYPSVNLKVVEKYAGERIPPVKEALREVAEETYGKKAAGLIVRAWLKFGEAFGEFPFHIGVLYRGPQQLGPANLLYPKPSGYSSTMTGFPYDNLDGWRAIYPRRVFENQFRKLARKWQAGVRLFASALSDVPDSLRPGAEADLRVAEAAGLHFESAADQAEFVRLRDELVKTRNENERRRILSRLRELCDREIDLARRLYRIARRDSRIGFEAANQYFYLPRDLLEKIVNCVYIRDKHGF